MPTTSMSGWWDASTLAPAQTYNTLTDKSAAGKNASAGGARAVAHMAGMMNGLYLEGSVYLQPYFKYLYPTIVDYAIGANGVAVGTGGSLTVFLVWSRPNQRQTGAVYGTETVRLMDINGTNVLSLTGNGDGNDTLLLNGAPAGKLALRHTHSARLVYSGTTLDLWLDDVKLISGATTAQLGTQANVSFLNNAQCVFHEAAAWSKVLSDAEHADLSGYAQRWPLGPRQAINGVLIGQSNAANFVGGANHIVVAKRLAYLTGCLSANLLFKSGGYGQINTTATIFSGAGLYNGSADLFLNSSSGGDPSTWPLGTNGNTFMAALDAMTPDQRANLRFVARLWSESDTSMAAMTLANKPTYIAAIKREMSLVRGHLGKTAAQLPYFVISALPSSTDEGCQAHRQAMADIIADTNLNVHWMLPQSGDAASQDDTVDANGVETGGGNSAHRDGADLVVYAHRMAIPIARSVIRAGTPDVLSTIDASIPQIGGPRVLSAHAESSTSVLVTVEHDGGTDLVVPLRAALGVGWTLNGLTIKATACARVSANQLRLTFPSVPAGALLYYGYGSNLTPEYFAVIGRGNAVTDNFSTVVLPAGWKIGADLGDTLNEQPNNPLQATPYGIGLS